MSSIAPGLIVDHAAVPIRVFLGSHPQLAVDKRLSNSLQGLHPWYLSRRRVKETSSEFLEVDAASCDPEILLRYSHIFFVRRQLAADITAKQTALLETGKPPKEAAPEVLACLSACNNEINDRIGYEERRMAAAKATASVPFRRELDPKLAFERADTLCMMRCVEEDDAAVPDAEMKARAFLPAAHMQQSAKALAELLLPDGGHKPKLEAKDGKLLRKLIPSDYDKVGTCEKWRPIDVTAFYRFYGERVPTSAATPFANSLWAHVFRRYASHPGYLQHVSKYWAAATGLHPQPDQVQMPLDVAKAVCKQQHMFAATKFRIHNQYTSAENSKHSWASEAYVPLMRMHGAIGRPSAEDLIAALAVDGFWASLKLADDTNIVSDEVIRPLQVFVRDTAQLRENNPDAFLEQLKDSLKLSVPPLSPAEKAWRPPRIDFGDATPPEFATGGGDEGDEGEGSPESAPIDGEML